MKAAEVPLPPLFQVRRRFDDLARKAGADHADAAARFEEFRDVAEIEIVGPEILIGVETDDRIEAAMRERQGVGFGEDRRDAIRKAGFVAPLLDVMRYDFLVC